MRITTDMKNRQTSDHRHRDSLASRVLQLPEGFSRPHLASLPGVFARESLDTFTDRFGLFDGLLFFFYGYLLNGFVETMRGSIV